MSEKMPHRELMGRGLPKWPALYVEGDSVTREQAMEILIRTDSFYFMCNDRQWTDYLLKTVGLSADGYWEDIMRVRGKYGVLDLNYLHNSRVAASYVGGPHGWCDWNGAIGCNSYNIGKWPSIEEVYDEWKRIASAFPYLNLRSMLFSGEYCDEGVVPLIEFVIKDGNVSLTEPTHSPNLAVDDDLHIERVFHGDWTHERGCDPKTFEEALKIVLSRTATDFWDLLKEA